MYIHVSMELATTEPMVLRYERVYVQHWDDVFRFLLASSEGSGGYPASWTTSSSLEATPRPGSAAGAKGSPDRCRRSERTSFPDADPAHFRELELITTLNLPYRYGVNKRGAAAS